MKIYTKTGDKGETGFIGGRVAKDSALMETIGSVDELNGQLGVVVALGDEAVGASASERRGPQTAEFGQQLEALMGNCKQTQATLFQLGAALADVGVDKPKAKKAQKQLGAHVSLLEQQIDAMTKQLPPLKNFILPGGSVVGAQLHVARSVCRRAERAVVSWVHTAEAENQVSAQYLQALSACQIYLNRLSDWLFTAARLANLVSGQPEEIWKPS